MLQKMTETDATHLLDNLDFHSSAVGKLGDFLVNVARQSEVFTRINGIEVLHRVGSFTKDWQYCESIAAPWTERFACADELLN